VQNKFLSDTEERIPYLSVGDCPLASLVVLSFNRPQFLHQTIASLKRNTEYPHELIVVDDGSMDPANVEFLMRLYGAKELSTLVLNAGRNQGVGASINRGFHAAHGKWLFKLDSDLEYRPQWLEKAVAILETFPEIGVLGLFRYWHDPCDWRKMLIRREERDGLVVQVAEDQVGSTMAMSRETYESHGDFIEGSYAFGADYEYKMALKRGGRWIALPDEDLVENFGFGLTTTSLRWKGEPVTVSKVPLIFGKGIS